MTQVYDMKKAKFVVFLSKGASIFLCEFLNQNHVQIQYNITIYSYWHSHLWTAP